MIYNIKMAFFHLILLGIPTSLILSFKKRGWGWCGSGLLKRQNPFSVTEVICRRSLITFDVSLTEKPKPFYMVISTCWLIVVPYQNILITGSKALRITTERKCLLVFFALREADKVGQKKILQNILKVAQIWEAKQKTKIARRKMERKTNVTFYQCDIFFMRYFLRLKYFKKHPRNAEIRY